MFDNLMGNLNNHQEAVKEKLESIIIEDQINDGAIVIKMNGNKKLLDLSFNTDKIDLQDKEAIEDLCVELINRTIAKVSEKEQEIMQSMIQDILPGGMSGLFS